MLFERQKDTKLSTMAEMAELPVITFPLGFKWGTATSSYQIEGAWDLDGKGESIWDRFTHTHGNIEDGSTGDVACDHYNLWPNDVKLMSDLGIQSYRFSISWPRLLPLGRGRANQAGLDFYSRLVDGLLQNGIEPHITLYHWDLPQPLEDEGGWRTRGAVEAFVEYADLVSSNLGDRVKMWGTLNEPYVSAMAGHRDGVHAPGLQDRSFAFNAAHHLLLAHGRAVPIIRANSPGAEIGIVLNLWPMMPASQSRADLDQARLADGETNRWYLDALSGRGYPADIMATLDDSFDVVFPGDMEIIAEPIDFLGINYYSRSVIRAADSIAPKNDPQTLFPGEEYTEMGWEVYPTGLYNTLLRVHNHYGFPAFYITENGAAIDDRVDQDGQIHDRRRISYFQRHLEAAQRAISAGVPLQGFYLWSFLDNFEWGFGYTKRFGMVYVDYETQRRTLKDSALWYRTVIAQNGFSI